MKWNLLKSIRENGREKAHRSLRLQLEVLEDRSLPTTIALDFNSLPSAQDWTYRAGPPPDGPGEKAVFFADGTKLTQNTMGTGITYSTYEMSHVIEPDKPFTITVRARVTQTETTAPGADATTLIVYAVVGSEFFGFGLNTSTIDAPYASKTYHGINATVFHEYRIEAVPHHSVSIYVDDALLVSRAPPRASSENTLGLGNASSFENGVAEITSYTFCQGQPDLLATTLAWNPAQGGVDFGYEVAGADLTEDTTAGLYWSADADFDPGVDTLAYETIIERPVDSYGPFYVPYSVLGTPPADATHLLLVVDPEDLVDESEANNVLAVLIPPDIAILAATTTDSRTIRFDYEIERGPISEFQVNFYRSADADFDAGEDVFIGADVIYGATTGTHSHRSSIVTPIDGTHPYVLVVADRHERVEEWTEDNNVASFRKWTLGVVTHGLTPGYAGLGGPFQFPDWVHDYASALAGDQFGYHKAVEFYWVNNSRRASSGMTILEGQNMAKVVRGEALKIAGLSGFQANRDVIDVHFIGHSRGAVVVSQALRRLATNPGIAPLEAGYKKAIFLDPHPGRNLAPLVFGIAEVLSPLNVLGISTVGRFSFQSRAAALGTLAFQMIYDDPEVVVPTNVHEAESYYQQTLARNIGGSYGKSVADAFMNLWGDAVAGAKRFELTGESPGISHGGVVSWYLDHVLR